MGLKLSSSKVPDFLIDNLPVSVDEGQSISPTISISVDDYNIIADTQITFAAYWEISGVGIASTDFENVGADGNPDPGTTLTGYVNLTGSTTSKQFPIGIRSDTFTDLNTNETATFSVYKDAARTQLSASDTFIINDTSPSTFEFLLVGGGGGGGYVNDDTTQQAGGGGGAGGVKVASHSDIFDNNPTVWIGIGSGGGSSSNGNSTYLRDTNSTGNVIDSVGGGGAGGDKVNGTFIMVLLPPLVVDLEVVLPVIVMVEVDQLMGIMVAVLIVLIVVVVEAEPVEMVKVVEVDQLVEMVALDMT